MDNLEKLRQLVQEAKQLRDELANEVQAELSRIETQVRDLAEKVKGTGINLDLYYLRDAVGDLDIAVGGSDWNSSNC